MLWRRLSPTLPTALTREISSISGRLTAMDRGRCWSTYTAADGIRRSILLALNVVYLTYEFVREIQRPADLERTPAPRTRPRPLHPERTMTSARVRG